MGITLHDDQPTIQTDALTGLDTGRHIRREMRDVLSDPAQCLGVCLVDMDRFKAINDNYGHETGDEILRQAGARLRNLAGDRDLVARDIGDEFLVVLVDADRVEDAALIGEWIRAAIAVPYVINGQTIRVTASLGVATSAYGQAQADTLLQSAGVALFAAKDEGRDKVVSFTSGMGISANRIATQREMVRDALRDDRIVVHYQPIVDGDGRVVAVEALARFESRQGEVHEPAVFLDAIIGTRLIIDLDHEVQRQAFDVAAELSLAFGDEAPWVACNVSAMTLDSPDCAERLLGELSDRNLSPDAVGIEITESAAFDAKPNTLAGLARLRDSGVRIALDDFGTGYSSLSHLVSLPLSIIKIDKSFIQRVNAPGPELAIARAVATLGESLGLTVVAEGVETIDQEATVRNLGVDYIQGWQIAEALDDESFRSLVADSTTEHLILT